MNFTNSVYMWKTGATINIAPFPIRIMSFTHSAFFSVARAIVNVTFLFTPMKLAKFTLFFGRLFTSIVGAASHRDTVRVEGG